MEQPGPWTNATAKNADTKSDLFGVLASLRTLLGTPPELARCALIPVSGGDTLLPLPAELGGGTWIWPDGTSTIQARDIPALLHEAAHVLTQSMGVESHDAEFAAAVARIAAVLDMPIPAAGELPSWPRQLPFTALGLLLESNSGIEAAIRD